MDESKKPQDEAQQPATGQQEHAQTKAVETTDGQPEKRLSRTTLTFYIIGLFLVAIALILVSYITQVRSDRQLQNLNTQLSDQQKVAQGATQKMEDLQKQLNSMSGEIDAAKQSLGIEAQDSLSESVQTLCQREQLLEQLVAAEEAARAEDAERLTELLEGFPKAWSAEQLKPVSQGGLFKEQDYAAYQSLLKISSAKNQ